MNSFGRDTTPLARRFFLVKVAIGDRRIEADMTLAARVKLLCDVRGVRQE
jgi:hypothetical protein